MLLHFVGGIRSADVATSRTFEISDMPEFSCVECDRSSRHMRVLSCVDMLVYSRLGSLILLNWVVGYKIIIRSGRIQRVGSIDNAFQRFELKLKV